MMRKKERRGILFFPS